MAEIETLAELLRIAEAKVEKLHVIAKNVSHALMSFTPGGSEYFTRVQVGDWEDYYADADVCQRRIRERIASAEELARGSRSSPATADAPSDDEIKAAREATQPYRKQIKETPALLSLLYDIDLLPEQIQRYVNAVRMAAVCMIFRELTPDAINRLTQPSVSDERGGDGKINQEIPQNRTID